MEGTRVYESCRHAKKKSNFFGFPWIFLGIKRGLQKIKNNNNMIRLVPARTESGRRK